MADRLNGHLNNNRKKQTYIFIIHFLIFFFLTRAPTKRLFRLQSSRPDTNTRFDGAVLGRRPCARRRRRSGRVTTASIRNYVISYLSWNTASTRVAATRGASDAINAKRSSRSTVCGWGRGRDRAHGTKGPAETAIKVRLDGVVIRPRPGCRHDVSNRLYARTTVCFTRRRRVPAAYRHESVFARGPIGF